MQKNLRGKQVVWIFFCAGSKPERELVASPLLLLQWFGLEWMRAPLFSITQEDVLWQP